VRPDLSQRVGILSPEERAGMETRCQGEMEKGSAPNVCVPSRGTRRARGPRPTRGPAAGVARRPGARRVRATAGTAARRRRPPARTRSGRCEARVRGPSRCRTAMRVACASFEGGCQMCALGGMERRNAGSGRARPYGARRPGGLLGFPVGRGFVDEARYAVSGPGGFSRRAEVPGGAPVDCIRPRGSAAGPK